jgi:hypothetical protein
MGLRAGLDTIMARISSYLLRIESRLSRSAGIVTVYELYSVWLQIFLFSTVSRLVLGPTQPRIQ